LLVVTGIIILGLAKAAIADAPALKVEIPKAIKIEIDEKL
jgi:hypothetical protein